jgi:hypothetical protein
MHVDETPAPEPELPDDVPPPVAPLPVAPPPDDVPPPVAPLPVAPPPDDVPPPVEPLPVAPLLPKSTDAPPFESGMGFDVLTLPNVDSEELHPDSATDAERGRPTTAHVMDDGTRMNDIASLTHRHQQSPGRCGGGRV